MGSGHRLDAILRANSAAQASALGSRKSGHGSIEQLPSGKWRAQTRIGAERKRVTVPGGPFATREEAEHALALYVLNNSSATALRDREAVEDQERRLATVTLLDIYVGYEAGRTRKEADRQDHERFADRVLRGTAKTTKPGDVLDGPAREITQTRLKEWVAALREHGMADSTIHKWAGFVDQLFNHAVFVGALDRSPLPPRGGRASIGVTTPRPKSHYAFTFEEYTRLHEATSAADHPLAWQMLMWSGLRSGEIRGLQAESISPRPGIIFVRKAAQLAPKSQAVLAQPKTFKSRRMLHVPTPLWEGLREKADVLIAAGDPEGLLFPATGAKAKGPLLTKDAWSKGYERLRARAGIVPNLGDPQEGRRRNPTGHDHRASVSSWLQAAGVPASMVAAHLGHSSPTITEVVYTEVTAWMHDDEFWMHLRTSPEIGGNALKVLDALWSRVTA